MISYVLKKVFGTKSNRDLKKIQPLVVRVSELEEEYQKLSEELLNAKTHEFKKRISDG